MAELYNIVYPDRLIFPHIGVQNGKIRLFGIYARKKVHKENLNIGANPTYSEKNCH